jgi:AraC family transcriptional regulator
MTAFGPVRFEDGPPMLMAGLRRRHVLADAPAGIPAQWDELRDAVRDEVRGRGGLPGRVGTARYGVICGSDATGIEYMCAVEVASFDGLPDGIGRLRVPAQHYAVFSHAGPAPALHFTWQRILDWLATGPWQSAHAPDFERYEAQADLRTGEGIEVWVGVVPRVAHRGS